MLDSVNANWDFDSSIWMLHDRRRGREPFLREFPDGFVDRFDIIGNGGDVLNRAVIRNNRVLHLVVPQSEVHQSPKEPGADYLEFTS